MQRGKKVAAIVAAIVLPAVVVSSFFYAYSRIEREETACRDGFVYLREGVCVPGYKP
jgi:hypothetical protein